MHKFSVTVVGDLKINAEHPTLYKVFFGNRGHFYLHKGKDFEKSYERFLYDVFRGLQMPNGVPVKVSNYYDNVVLFLKKNPSIYKVGVMPILNASPEQVIKEEERLLRKYKKQKDTLSLNKLELEQLKPEWMIKSFIKKCSECISGVKNGNKRATHFKFCPMCGRSISDSNKSNRLLIM